MAKKESLKVEHIWSLLASDSSIDQATNNLTIFNIVEQIGLTMEVPEGVAIEATSTTPIDAPLNLQLITRLRKKTPGEKLNLQFKTILVGPNGEEREPNGAQDINFAPNTNNFRVRTGIGQIAIFGSGTYHFSIRVKEEGAADFVEIGKVPLDIKFDIAKRAA